MTTALILIDLMPRIVARPLAPHTGEDVLDRCRRLAAAFRERGNPVVLVRVERPNLTEQPPGGELAPDLERPGDIVVVKRTIGAFHNTDLHDQLQRRNVTTLVFGGIATNMGVESTARAASDHGYELEFVEDAMTGLTAEEHECAIKRNFPRFGAIRTTEDYGLNGA